MKCPHWSSVASFCVHCVYNYEFDSVKEMLNLSDIFRFEGLKIKIKPTKEYYMLKGGIKNWNWVKQERKKMKEFTTKTQTEFVVMELEALQESMSDAVAVLCLIKEKNLNNEKTEESKSTWAEIDNLLSVTISAFENHISKMAEITSNLVQT
jgi:hypothetical protein